MTEGELPIFQKDKEDENEKLKDNDSKKEETIKEIKHNKNKLIYNIKKFYFSLFNKKNASIRYIFFILVIITYLELYLGNLSDMLILKFTMSIIFVVPIIILVIEFENFLKACSLFEINSLFFIKGLVLFSQKLSYKDILIFNFFQNFFHCIYFKKLFINT